MSADLTPRDELQGAIDNLFMSSCDFAIGAVEDGQKAETDLLALIERQQRDAVAAVARERDVARAEVEKLLADLKLMEHKVITCGVAASNPDPELTTREKCYAETWNSPQADAVRALRAERDRLLAQLTKLIERQVNPLMVVGDDGVPLQWSIRQWTKDERLKDAIDGLFRYGEPCEKAKQLVHQANKLNDDEAHGRGGAS